MHEKSFFPFTPTTKRESQPKMRLGQGRVEWRGVDAYLGRAEGRRLHCRPHCFFSPGYWPGACPRQLWAELISVVRELPPLSTQFPFPLPKPWAFLFLLTASTLRKEVAKIISTQWELFHLSVRDQTRVGWQRPQSAPVSILPVITSNPNTTLLIAS